MELFLPSSKTDPFRRGILLTIAAADDDACPVRSLRRLFERYPTNSPSAPLFFTSSTQYFTQQFVIDTLRVQFRKLGIDGHYSGYPYSFRRGAATSGPHSGAQRGGDHVPGKGGNRIRSAYTSKRTPRTSPPATTSPGAPLGAFGS